MAKKRITFQGILVFVFVASVIVFTRFVFPDWKREPLEELFDNLGIILVLFGFLLRILARGYKEEMSDNGHRLVIEGPYSVMRNPMYFGTLLIGVGAIAVLIKWWALPGFIILYSLVYLPQINKEEKALLNKFGKDYEAYCKRTPKYLPNILALLNFRKYVPLLKLSWIKKEGSSLSVTLAVIFLIEVYQDMRLFGIKELLGEFLEFLLVIVIFSVITLIFIYSKPKGLITIFFICLCLFSSCLYAEDVHIETGSKPVEILTWQDCVKEAAKNHPALISAEEKIKQSEESKNITKSAVFPQINSTLSGGTAQSASGVTTDTYSYGVTGSQLLFDGKKKINEMKAAQEDIKAAEYNYRFISQEVRLALRKAFINLLKAQELLRITEEIHSIRRSNLVSITLRYETGLEHKGALLTAEANLAQAKFEISQAKRGRALAERQLLKEMGRKGYAVLEANEGLDIKSSSREKPDIELLIENNPSLLKIAAQRQSAEYGLKAAYSDFYPSVSGDAGAGKTNSKWPPEKDQWDIGITVSFPIFEGGSRLAQKNQAKAVLNQLNSDEINIKDTLITALEQAWADLEDAIDTIEVQKKFLESSEERAKIAELQYSLGLIQFDNWTIIEDDLVTKKRNFLNAGINALISEANWIYAKGETLEYAE